MRLGLGPFENNSQRMQQPLSEKAKGKQRADSVPVDAFNNGGPIPPRQLMVRFTEGVQDLVLDVAEDDSVRDVKAKVMCPMSLMIASALWACIPLILSFYTPASDSRSAPQTPAPSLAPHPRWTAPPRRDETIILARHARRAPAARSDQNQRRNRPIDIAYRTAHWQLLSLGSRRRRRRAVASLLRRRPTR